MSFALVIGPLLGGRLDAEKLGATHVRTRGPDERPGDRAQRLRELLEPGVHTVVLLGAGTALDSGRDAGRPRIGLVADHLNLTGDNPLVGPNDDAWGPRFPDLTDAWNADLRRTVRAAALDRRIEVFEGILASVRSGTGTDAERNMWRSLGAELSAESFAEEAIVARHAGRRVVGLLALHAPGAEGGPDDVAVNMLTELLVAAESSIAGKTG